MKRKQRLRLFVEGGDRAGCGKGADTGMEAEELVEMWVRGGG